MTPSAETGPWTSEEDDQLRKLAGSGKRLADIADEINRSGGAVRMRAARLKIAIAESGKLMACPAWLELSEDRTSFVFLPDRAEIVRQIFELSVAGLGGYTIAKQLNAQSVPTFGPSPKWDQSTIHNMLTNRATIGERHSKRYLTAQERSDGVRDRKGLPTGDTLRGYTFRNRKRDFARHSPLTCVLKGSDPSRAFTCRAYSQPLRNKLRAL
jgi:hypothetical protein